MVFYVKRPVRDRTGLSYFCGRLHEPLNNVQRPANKSFSEPEEAGICQPWAATEGVRQDEPGVEVERLEVVDDQIPPRPILMIGVSVQTDLDPAPRLAISRYLGIHRLSVQVFSRLFLILSDHEYWFKSLHLDIPITWSLADEGFGERTTMLDRQIRHDDVG